MDFQKIQEYYSRESVQNALVEIAKDREVISVFKDGKFGRRPDMIQYPQDLLQAVSEGAVSFHGSVERWNQPMKLDVGMTKAELDKMRKGFDIFIDPDVKDFDIAKLTVKHVIEAFKDHGTKSFSVKYSGGKGFHIGVVFEALPERINMQPTQTLYPDVLQKIIEYIKWYIAEQLKEELLALDTPMNIAKRVGKPIEQIVGDEGVDPFKVVSMDVFGSRHLFRLPYSLHESSFLVSLPISPDNIDKFKKEDALPDNVKVEEKFLIPKAKRDAEGLIVEAMDWATKHRIEAREEITEPRRLRKITEIPEKYFPPCMVQGILRGLSDGRKRSLFILINFLRNMGWDWNKIEKRLTEWNEKNYPPLRTNLLRTQIRWHARQERNILPPNCDNAVFYIDMHVCNPDETCKGGTEKIIIKNPINYPFKRIKRK
jgi:hypothetical protein